MRDQIIRAALDRHWSASDANDFDTEHSIYHEDAVLEYPQSGERFRGRCNIRNNRAKQPSKKRFAVRRIIRGQRMARPVGRADVHVVAKPNSGIAALPWPHGAAVY